MAYRLLPHSYLEVGDDIKFEKLWGTVVNIVHHPNGYSCSIWLSNPHQKWVEGFEWIISGNPFILKKGK